MLKYFYLIAFLCSISVGCSPSRQYARCFEDGIQQSVEKQGQSFTKGSVKGEAKSIDVEGSTDFQVFTKSKKIVENYPLSERVILTHVGACYSSATGRDFKTSVLSDPSPTDPNSIDSSSPSVTMTTFGLGLTETKKYNYTDNNTEVLIGTQYLADEIFAECWLNPEDNGQLRVALMFPDSGPSGGKWVVGTDGKTELIVDVGEGRQVTAICQKNN